MIGTLFDDERCPSLGGGDVLAQVATVDRLPDLVGEGGRLVVAHVGEAAKEALRVLKHRASQCVEAVDEPRLDEQVLRVKIDREVEVVAHELFIISCSSKEL